MTINHDQTIPRSLFDKVIDCLYEYDLGQELPTNWPHDVRDAIEGARQRIMKQQPTPIQRFFTPATGHWQKADIADFINRYAIGPLIEESDWHLQPEDFSDAEAQRFVDLNQEWMENLAAALEQRGMDDDRAEQLRDWVKSLAKSQPGG